MRLSPQRGLFPSVVPSPCPTASHTHTHTPPSPLPRHLPFHGVRWGALPPPAMGTPQAAEPPPPPPRLPRPLLLPWPLLGPILLLSSVPTASRERSSPSLHGLSPPLKAAASCISHHRQGRTGRVLAARWNGGLRVLPLTVGDPALPVSCCRREMQTGD